MFLVFAAVLLLAFVVLMVAAGQRVLHRQQLQDAADAAAVGSAVIHAKALNLLALTNLLMAALLAVVVALTLMADVLAIVAGALSAICASSWLTGQVWACGLVPTAWELQQEFSSLRDRARPQLIRAARALQPFQDVVRLAAPAWAAAEGVLAARANLPDATVAILPLPTTPLPTERRSFDELCDHALRMVADPIRRIPPALIFKRVAGWVEGMLGRFRSHYCGDDAGGGGRTQQVRYEKGIPAQPTDPPTPGAGCAECRGHRDVKRYYLTAVDETWQVVRRPGQPPETTTPVRAPARHVESRLLPCLPSCADREHCQRHQVEQSTEHGVTVERHTRTHWTLDACAVEEVRTVDGGEPLPSDIRPVGLGAGWAKRGRSQTRAFVLEGAGTLRMDAWRDDEHPSSRALAMAQAEFWSPSSGDGLWTMDWRARLRRFRAPGAAEAPPGVGGLPARDLLDRLLLH